LAAFLRLTRLRRPRAEPVDGDPIIPAVAALTGVLDVRAAVAGILVVEVAADLVPLRQLCGHPPAGDFPAARGTGVDARIDDVVPLGWIAGIQIPESPGDVVVLAQRSRDPIKPHLVPFDRAADREAGVPVLDDLGRRRNAVRLQRIVDVVALRPW